MHHCLYIIRVDNSYEYTKTLQINLITYCFDSLSMDFLLSLYAILLLVIAGKYASQAFEASFDQNYYPTYGRVIHQGNEVLLLLDHTSGLIHYSLILSLCFFRVCIRITSKVDRFGTQNKSEYWKHYLSVKYKRFSPSCATITER